MLGTVVGFILADTVGIFGFTLPVVTGWAYEALVAELVSAAVLAVLVVRSWLASQGGWRAVGAGARQVAAMPTMGALRWRPPIEP